MKMEMCEAMQSCEGMEWRGQSPGKRAWCNVPLIVKERD